jgi:hypothetical protein
MWEGAVEAAPESAPATLKLFVTELQWLEARFRVLLDTCN